MTPSKHVLNNRENTTSSNRVDLLSSDGMSMIFLLIILAVSGIAMMGIMSMGNVQRRSQSQSMVPSQIVTIRGNILNTLKNYDAFKQTASDSHNTTFTACFNSPTIPCIGTNMPLVEVLTATGSASAPNFYANDGGLGNKGYATDGSLCTQYPSEQCPITMEVLWSCTPSGGPTAGCDLATSYSNMQFQVIPHYKPIRLTTGQLSPDAVILDETKYKVGPVARTSTVTFYNFP